MSKKKKIIIIAVAVVLVLAIVAAVIILLNVNKKFTVTFDTDGGTKIESIQVKKNEKCRLPRDPEKEGYIFLYWLDENGNSVLNDFVVTEDRTLKAKWAEEDAKMFTVKFDTDGGNSIPDILVIEGEKVALPANPTKEGYDFKMWVDANGQKFDKETIITEDITLKATWEKKKEEEKKDEPKDEPKPAENTEVTGISLDKSQVDLIIGGTGKLTATVEPSSATDKSVTWSSSDSSIISVDSSGNLTANGLGHATITAKTSNGKTASATVYSDIESINISASKTYISKNGTKSSTLTVTTTPAVDASLIKWSAPDATGQNAPASFSGSGKTGTVTARDMSGQVKVTASVGGKSASTIIYVEQPLNDLYFTSGSAIVNRNTYVEIHSNIPVTWTLNNASEFAVNVNKQSYSVSFTSQNKRDHQEGFTITATSNGGQTKTISISVNAK